VAGRSIGVGGDAVPLSSGGAGWRVFGPLIKDPIPSVFVMAAGDRAAEVLPPTNQLPVSRSRLGVVHA